MRILIINTSERMGGPAVAAGRLMEALKNNGLPAGSVPAEYRDGKLRFTADTSARPGGVMAYHLTR